MSGVGSREGVCFVFSGSRRQGCCYGFRVQPLDSTSRTNSAIPGTLHTRGRGRLYKMNGMMGGGWRCSWDLPMSPVALLL